MELWRYGASELAAIIAGRQASCREVVQAHLDRIQAVNAGLNAVTVVLGEQALAEADRLDARPRESSQAGPLFGVPVTIKENIDVAGGATTQGVPAMANLIAAADSPHIGQLRAAGAIPIGRTNLPDFALRWHTDSYLRGPTRNPWDAGRSPGGSSGGEAAAIASGMSPLGFGNDLGGSVRVPAQFCGICSIRPTRGRVAQHVATMPAPPLSIELFNSEGPMARRVADLRAALEVMSGFDVADPWYTPAPLNGPPVPRRVAVVADPSGGGVDPEVASGVRRAADLLASAGYAVEEAEPPVITEAAALWASIIWSDVRRLWPTLKPVVGPDAAAWLEEGLRRNAPLGLEGYAQGWTTRTTFARQWARFMAEFPLVLGPVSTEPAFPVGADLADPQGFVATLRLVVCANLLCLPAAAVPVGVADQLPQGVQVIGPRFREDLILDAAQAIEDRLGVITPIDPR
jgi:amidase